MDSFKWQSPEDTKLFRFQAFEPFLARCSTRMGLPPMTEAFQRNPVAFVPWIQHLSPARGRGLFGDIAGLMVGLARMRDGQRPGRSYLVLGPYYEDANPGSDFQDTCRSWLSTGLFFPIPQNAAERHYLETWFFVHGVRGLSLTDARCLVAGMIGANPPKPGFVRGVCRQIARGLGWVCRGLWPQHARFWWSPADYGAVAFVDRLDRGSTLKN